MIPVRMSSFPCVSWCGKMQKHNLRANNITVPIDTTEGFIDKISCDWTQLSLLLVY